MEFRVEDYKIEYKDDWERFVLFNSINGTFLQSRAFLEYHQTRFEDASLIIYKGNEIMAVLPACRCIEGEDVVFYSHKGSTYGGIILSEKIYTPTKLDILFSEIELYLKNDGFTRIVFKQTPSIYEKKDTNLLEYFMYKEGYAQYVELNYYMPLEEYVENIALQFTASKRRDYKYSLKNELEFRQLNSLKEIKEFYTVLSKNQRRLEIKSVHSFEELIDLKYNRLSQNIEFYGVYKDEKLIAGSMVFLFENDVFHTQYLASDEDYLKCYPMDYLIYHLIETAISKKMTYFSFGICTEDRGRYLNLGLSRFKEGFGTHFCNNKIYEKNLV